MLRVVLLGMVLVASASTVACGAPAASTPGSCYIKDVDPSRQHVVVVDGVDGGAPASTGVPSQECGKWQSNLSYLMQHAHLDWTVTRMSAADFEQFTHRKDVGSCQIDFGSSKMWELYDVISDDQGVNLATQLCAIPVGTPSPAPQLSGAAVDAACQAQATLSAAIAGLPPVSPDMTVPATLISKLEAAETQFASAARLAGIEGATSAQTAYTGVSSDIGQLVQGFASRDPSVWGTAIGQLNTDVRATPHVTC